MFIGGERLGEDDVVPLFIFPVWQKHRSEEEDTSGHLQQCHQCSNQREALALYQKLDWAGVANASQKPFALFDCVDPLQNNTRGHRADGGQGYYWTGRPDTQKKSVLSHLWTN